MNSDFSEIRMQAIFLRTIRNRLTFLSKYLTQCVPWNSLSDTLNEKFKTSFFEYFVVKVCILKSEAVFNNQNRVIFLGHTLNYEWYIYICENLPIFHCFRQSLRVHHTAYWRCVFASRINISKRCFRLNDYIKLKISLIINDNYTYWIILTFIDERWRHEQRHRGSPCALPGEGDEGGVAAKVLDVLTYLQKTI